MKAGDYCSVFLLVSILCIAIPILLLLENSTTRIIHYPTTYTAATTDEDSKTQLALTTLVSRNQFLERLGSYTRKTFSVNDDSHQMTNLSLITEPNYLVDFGSSKGRVKLNNVTANKSESIFQKVRDIRTSLRQQTMSIMENTLPPWGSRLGRGTKRRSLERHGVRNEIMGAVSNHSVLSIDAMNEQRKAFVEQLNAKLVSPTATLPPQCSDPLCTQYLVPYGWSEFNKCYQHSMRKSHQKLPLLNKCRFMNGTNRAPVALASLPGSGNTWVRGLLEQATGICTGAIYCDSGLRIGGFSGEAVMSGATLVVKTHSIGPSWTVMEPVEFTPKGRQKFGSAILLIRNPADAIVAEWNRRKANSTHTSYVGRELFGNNSEWNTFVEHVAVVWRYYFTWVLKSTDGHRTLVVRYEDVKTDPAREVKRMLTFLGVPFTDDELQHRLAGGFDQFHRHHSVHEQFEHYTDHQKEYLKSVIRQTNSTLQNYGYEQAFRIDEYYSDL